MCVYIYIYIICIYYVICMYIYIMCVYLYILCLYIYIQIYKYYVYIYMNIYTQGVMNVLWALGGLRHCPSPHVYHELLGKIHAVHGDLKLVDLSLVLWALVRVSEVCVYIECVLFHWYCGR